MCNVQDNVYLKNRRTRNLDILLSGAQHRRLHVHAIYNMQYTYAYAYHMYIDIRYYTNSVQCIYIYIGKNICRLKQDILYLLYFTVPCSNRLWVLCAMNAYKSPKMDPRRFA